MVPTWTNMGPNMSKYEAQSFLAEGTFALFGCVNDKTQGQHACRDNSGEHPRDMTVSCRGLKMSGFSLTMIRTSRHTHHTTRKPCTHRHIHREKRDVTTELRRDRRGREMVERRRRGRVNPHTPYPLPHTAHIVVMPHHAPPPRTPHTLHFTHHPARNTPLHIPNFTQTTALPHTTTQDHPEHTDTIPYHTHRHTLTDRLTDRQKHTHTHLCFRGDSKHETSCFLFWST